MKNFNEEFNKDKKQQQFEKGLNKDPETAHTSNRYHNQL